jgi:hypothetical protein
LSEPTPPSPEQILMPSGRPVGVAGPGRKVRIVQGDQKTAEDMFADLSFEGKLNTPPGYPGKGFDLPSGGWVGLRPTSKSGEPTIDIDIPGIPLRKIKFT